MKDLSRCSNEKRALVSYRDATPPLACPYGQTQRIVTGGAGGIANVHVITVTEGSTHVHREYDEVYYVLSGEGFIVLDGEEHSLRPGAVVVIPSGVSHSLAATSGEPLEFVIFGTPPMAMDDPGAKPCIP